jgi:hypothetical protein
MVRRTFVATGLAGSLFLPISAFASGPSLAPRSRVAEKEADKGAITATEPEVSPIVRVAALGGIASRSFSYRDRISPFLRSYDLSAVPTAGGRIDVAPLARTHSVLRGLAMYGDFAAALGLSSESKSTSGSSRWTRWDAGAHLLFSIGRARAGAAFGYGRETFGVDLAGVGTAPSVDYAFLRPALEGGLDLGRFAIDASGAYLAVLDGGALANSARGTSLAGVEGRAVLRYAVSRYIDVSIGAVYTRFFYTFKPEPGDPFVAGGALDQMMRGELALAGRY